MRKYKEPPKRTWVTIDEANKILKEKIAKQSYINAWMGIV